MAKATKSTLMVEYKNLGREPEFKDSGLLTEVELVRIYSWYNALRDNDDAKEFITDYCKQNNIKISISKHTTNTYAWLARIISRGAKVTDRHVERLHAYLATLKPERVEKTKEAVATPTRSTNKLDLWLPVIEDAVDNYQNGFDPYQFFVSQSIPQNYVKQIVEFYRPQLMEVHDAYQKTSDDVVQAYKCFSRTELKKFGLFLKAIVDDGERYVGNAKKERRPRKKKARSTASILKYFKCQQNSVELKVSSEDPSKIIGASAVYVLNTKNNILTMFVAADDKGLTVSRTSIANYDEKQTISKRVGRKVESVIKQILEGTKKSRLKVLEKVATEATSVSDRVSENHIILKVDK